MSSEVRSYRLGSSRVPSPKSSRSDAELDGEEPADRDVAITKNVVRSKRMTSVAPQALENVDRCFERIDALGIKVWTIFDQA